VVHEDEATFSPHLDQLLEWSTIIGGHHMGPDLVEQFGRRNAVPGELLVIVTPTRIVARANMADWSRRLIVETTGECHEHRG
jgi:hypothetical protein